MDLFLKFKNFETILIFIYIYIFLLFNFHLIMKYNKNIYRRIHFCVSYMLFIHLILFFYTEDWKYYTFQEIVKIKSLKVLYSHKSNSSSFFFFYFIFYFILFHLVSTSIYRFLLIRFSNHIDILALSLPLWSFQTFVQNCRNFRNFYPINRTTNFFFYYNTHMVTFLIIPSNYVNFQLYLNLNK